MGRSDDNNKPSRVRKFAATFVVLLLTVATVALLMVTFDRGGWWILALVVWLPIFYPLCAWLGHPVEKGSGSDGPPIID